MRMVTKLERLREIALDQHGFVTTAQALDAGVVHAELSTMVSRERLERAAHGVYRVPQVPHTEFDEYHLALLWSGADEVCLSHDTALDVWGITDINPDTIHLTVSTRRRIRRSGGVHYTVHYQDLRVDEVTLWQGMRIVTLGTAIGQGIKSGIPTYLLRQALDRGGKTSLLRSRDQESLTQQLGARDG